MDRHRAEVSRVRLDEQRGARLLGQIGAGAIYRKCASERVAREEWRGSIMTISNGRLVLHADFSLEARREFIETARAAIMDGT